MGPRSIEAQPAQIRRSMIPRLTSRKTSRTTGIQYQQASRCQVSHQKFVVHDHVLPAPLQTLSGDHSRHLFRAGHRFQTSSLALHSPTSMVSTRGFPVLDSGKSITDDLPYSTCGDEVPLLAPSLRPSVPQSPRPLYERCRKVSSNTRMKHSC